MRYRRYLSDVLFFCYFRNIPIRNQNSPDRQAFSALLFFLLFVCASFSGYWQLYLMHQQINKKSCPTIQNSVLFNNIQLHKYSDCYLFTLKQEGIKYFLHPCRHSDDIIKQRLLGLCWMYLICFPDSVWNICIYCLYCHYNILYNSCTVNVKTLWRIYDIRIRKKKICLG